MPIYFKPLTMAIVIYLLEILVQWNRLVISVSNSSKITRMPETRSDFQLALDCSKQYESHNLSLPLGPNASSLFLEPILHECIRAHTYNTQQLPLRVGELRTPLDITYNFFFTNLLLFESDGTIGFKAFLRFEWRDRNLAWDVEELPLRKLRLHYQEVWTPLFLLANCETDLCYVIPHNRTNVGLENDGTVTFVVQIKQLATCVMNLKAFPYDLERCRLIFYLADYKSREIRLRGSWIQTEYFRFSSEEWKLQSISDQPINYNVTEYRRSAKNASVWNFSSLRSIDSGTTGFLVELCFTRHDGYYLYNLITPVLIVAAIGLFTVFLPPFAGDKINLAVTVLLGFLFVQEIVAELMPKSESIPYLAVYVVFSLMVATANVAACALVVAVSNISPTSRPPLLIRVLVVRLIGTVFLGSYILLWQLLCWFLHGFRYDSSSTICSFSSCCCCFCCTNVPRQLNPPADSSTAVTISQKSGTREKHANNNPSVEVPLQVLNSVQLRERSLEPTPSSVSGVLGVSGAPPFRREVGVQTHRTPPPPPPRSSSCPPPSPSSHSISCPPRSPPAPRLPSSSATPSSPSYPPPPPLSLFQVVAPSSSAAAVKDIKESRLRPTLKKKGRAVRGMSPKRSYSYANLQSEKQEKKIAKTELQTKQKLEHKLQLLEQEIPEEEQNFLSHSIGLGEESWQDIARVMNIVNSFVYIGASAYIFWAYFIPILPFSTFNIEINGECPESGLEKSQKF